MQIIASDLQMPVEFTKYNVDHNAQIVDITSI